MEFGAMLNVSQFIINDKCYNFNCIFRVICKDLGVVAKALSYVIRIMNLSCMCNKNGYSVTVNHQKFALGRAMSKFKFK